MQIYDKNITLNKRLKKIAPLPGTVLKDSALLNKLAGCAKILQTHNCQRKKKKSR